MTTTKYELIDLLEKSRAELLELCRAAGYKATAWKKETMIAVLTGQQSSSVAGSEAGAAAAARPSGNALAKQLERREQNPTAEAKANLAARNGACVSVTCVRAGTCTAYVPGEKDDFGWQMCLCGHTKWAHEKDQPAAAAAAAATATAEDMV